MPFVSHEGEDKGIDMGMGQYSIEIIELLSLPGHAAHHISRVDSRPAFRRGQFLLFHNLEFSLVEVVCMYFRLLYLLLQLLQFLGQWSLDWQLSLELLAGFLQSLGGLHFSPGLLEKVQHLILQIIGTMSWYIFMKLVMSDFLHLNKLHIIIPSLHYNLLVHQPGLLNWYYFISCTVHHQHLSIYFCYVVDIGKMVLLEFYIDCVLVVEHAWEGTDWTLKDTGWYWVFCWVVDHWKWTQAETPQNYVLKGTINPGQHQLKIFAYYLLSHFLQPALTIPCVIKDHPFRSEFICHFRYEVEWIPHIWWVSVCVYDAGKELAFLGVRGEDPNYWDAMGGSLEDFYLLVMVGWGEVPFLIEVE